MAAWVWGAPPPGNWIVPNRKLNPVARKRLNVCRETAGPAKSPGVTLNGLGQLSHGKRRWQIAKQRPRWRWDPVLNDVVGCANPRFRCDCSGQFGMRIKQSRMGTDHVLLWYHLFAGWQRNAGSLQKVWIGTVADVVAQRGVQLEDRVWPDAVSVAAANGWDRPSCSKRAHGPSSAPFHHRTSLL